MSTTQTEAVRKSVVVAASPETAFEVFTDGIGRWWPLETHGIFGGETAGVGFEEGRLVERSKDGRESVWGTVLDWDPPRRVRFTWRPGFAPETPDTEVEVLFTAEDDGTRVELVHTGWDRLEDGAKTRTGYDSGWPKVLDRYREAV